MGQPLSRIQAAEELDERILSVLSLHAEQTVSKESFHALAVDIFQHQWAFHPFLRRVWSRWIDHPGQVKSAWDIPPVPHTAFKYGWVSGASPIQTTALYRTSGTTDSVRGRHGMDTLSLYRTGSLATFQHFMLPDAPGVAIHALMPSPQEAPESSLSAMVGFVMEEMDSQASPYWMTRGELDDEGLLSALEKEEGPVMLLGTTFSFVHLCDRMASRGESFSLPAGSRIMETGGFKGRSREVTRTQLLDMIAERLGVPPERVVNEYGMTELSSQLYTPALVDGRQDIWCAPPWLLPRALDPITRKDVAPGEVGVLAFVDLANRGSAVSVLTADLGQVHEDGSITVLGRAAGLSPRGCSWAVDMALSPVSTMDTHGVDKMPSKATLHERSRLLRRERTQDEIIRALGTVSQNWLDPEDPFRQEALASLEKETAFSLPVIAAGLDASFSQWGEEALRRLVETDIHVDALFDSSASIPRAVGIVAAGNVPTPVAFDIMASLLVGAAPLVRPSSQAPSFPGIFRRSLAAADPLLAEGVELLFFERDDTDALAAMGRAVDVMVANGQDETMERIRSLLPEETRLVAHGTRISIGLLSAEALTSTSITDVARAAARDVSLWDQQGCLSPVVWFVEETQKGASREFAQLLQDALHETAETLPVGKHLVESAVSAMAWEDESWVRQVGDGSIQVIGKNILLSREPVFVENTHRRLQVFPISTWDEVRHALAEWHGRVSTVILAMPASRQEAVLQTLAPIGMTRTCAPGEAQSPPSTWHQDGIPPLSSLL